MSRYPSQISSTPFPLSLSQNHLPDYYNGHNIRIKRKRTLTESMLKRTNCFLALILAFLIVLTGISIIGVALLIRWQEGYYQPLMKSFAIATGGSIPKRITPTTMRP